jgi:hypothetical protein
MESKGNCEYFGSFLKYLGPRIQLFNILFKSYIQFQDQITNRIKVQIIKSEWIRHLHTIKLL